MRALLVRLVRWGGGAGARENPLERCHRYDRHTNGIPPPGLPTWGICGRCDAVLSGGATCGCRQAGSMGSERRCGDWLRREFARSMEVAADASPPGVVFANRDPETHANAVVDTSAAAAVGVSPCWDDLLPSPRCTLSFTAQLPATRKLPALRMLRPWRSLRCRKVNVHVEVRGSCCGVSAEPAKNRAISGK
jgi:hypothetical protein